jgi:hypothetical protein
LRDWLPMRETPMADLQIRIETTGSGSAAFLPQGGHLGGPLEARAGDNVRWRNMTDQEHQPWPADDKFVPLSEADVAPGINFLSYPIPARQSGAAAYSVVWPPNWPKPQTGNIIHYCCKLHPEEHGLIIEET